MRVVRSVAQRRLLYHWVSGHEGALTEVLRAGLRLETSAWPRARDSLTLRIETPLETMAPASLADARERMERFLVEFLSRIEELEKRMERKKFS